MDVCPPSLLNWIKIRMTASIISIDDYRAEEEMPTPPVHDWAKPALVALGGVLKHRAYQFVTVSPLTHKRINARPASAWAHDLCGIFGWSRPFTPALAGDDILGLMRQAGVVEAANGALHSRLRASTLDGQLYFHSAYPTTAAEAVFFGPDTYRFVRALSAVIGALGHPVARAADIGCGAGPGAVTIALALPDAAVYAVDINPAALALTQVNAELAGANNLIAVESNLLRGVEGQFDLIVSNPPYLVDREQRAYRHGGGDLGAGLSIAVVDEAIARLAPGGTLLLYTGVALVANADPFRHAVEPLLTAAGFTWTYEEIDPDVFGEELDEPAYAFADRIAAVWLRASSPWSAAATVTTDEAR